jgi:hypothetical protein
MKKENYFPLSLKTQSFQLETQILIILRGKSESRWRRTKERRHIKEEQYENLKGKENKVAGIESE